MVYYGIQKLIDFLYNGEYSNIISYNIINHHMHEVHIPFLDDKYSFDVLYFGESRVHLHLIISCKCGISDFYFIMVANDYSKWSILYHINLNSQILEKNHL